MAWTEFTRPRCERSGGRYASDVSDAEWALIELLMPASGPTAGVIASQSVKTTEGAPSAPRSAKTGTHDTAPFGNP